MSSASEYKKDAPEPSATSVSILGAPCIKDVRPDEKNFPFMIITVSASTSSKHPRKMRSSKIAGAGKSHIICPIEKYMRITSTGIEKIRRLFSFGVS